MHKDVLIAYLHGLGIMALLTIIYGHICRRPLKPEPKAVLIGLTFGLGAVLAMSTPAVVAPGVIVDARSIVIAFAAAFGGIVSAFISAAIAAAFRYQLGGEGMLPGVLCIVLASLIGLFWARVVKPRVERTWIRLAIFAALSPFALLSMFVLPWDKAYQLFAMMLVPNALTSIAATIVLGAMLEEERAEIASEEVWRERASKDGLTGLGNRSAFDDELEKRLHNTGGRRSPTALLIIDADYFKLVNDRFGHIVGDAVLKRLSYILNSAIGPQDFAARLGGEEFGILLETRSPNRTEKIAENIRIRVEAAPFEANGRGFGITVSVGCAVARKGDTPETLYSAADRALYDAKNNGRNQVSLAGSRAEQIAKATEVQMGLFKS